MHSPIPKIADAEDQRLLRRRWIVVILCLASMAALALAMDGLLERRGWSLAAVAFMTIYLLSLPWTLLGFWNAVIGFVILRLVKDPVGYTNPALVRTPENDRRVQRVIATPPVIYQPVSRSPVFSLAAD